MTERGFWFVFACAFGAGLLLVWLTGCVSTIYTTSPPCPIPSEQAEAQLGQMMLLAATEHIDIDALDHYLGEQERFCGAIDRGSVEDSCVGSKLSCWWYGVWN